MNPLRVFSELCPRNSLVVLAASMLLGCAGPMSAQTSQVPVWTRSHNRSTIEVYLLCGDRNATWLGIIGPQETAALSFPTTSTRCVRGLNFFLVDRKHNHGYWVGPMYPRYGSRIELVIERYAGLSVASVGRD
jgi:hypothetical protein